MSARGKSTQPTTWQAFERGRAGSLGTLDSVAEDDDLSRTPTAAVLSPSPSHDSGAQHGWPVTGQEENGQDGQPRQRRRSSFATRFDSLRRMGGPNSIDNFTSSIQRAAGFHEIGPLRRDSITSTQGDEEHNIRQRPKRPALQSILTQQILGQSPNSAETIKPNDTAVQEQADETTSLLPPTVAYSIRSRLDSNNYGMSYGSISSRLSQTARKRATILQEHQIEASLRARELAAEFKNAEVEDELCRTIEVEARPDGEVIERTVGESTVPMTTFNSTNVLIGVGILALPLAIRYSGWVIGIVFLTLAALVTQYTAKILAKCLDTNTASSTYGDIAFVAFDWYGRAFVEFLFVLELTAANVALVILFGDSMHSLIPSVPNLYWKMLLSIGLLPLNFVPFKTLSLTSILGITCMIGLIILLITDGLIKPHAPGSIREVVPTHLFPETWKTLPLSIGLFMAPWGGHSVFPAVYKDMRHPQKYHIAVRNTYIFTYGLDLSMAVIGYLMFGDKVRDEITSNILMSPLGAYPRAISFVIVVLIAIIPITKIPLSNRPIQDTINKKFYIDLRQMDPKARAASERSLAHRLGRISVGVFCNLLQLGIAIIVPNFDSIMALMGSALCLTICTILPVAFYLKMFWESGTLKLLEKVYCFAILIVSAVLAVVGTIYAVLPKEKTGAE